MKLLGLMGGNLLLSLLILLAGFHISDGMSQTHKSQRHYLRFRHTIPESEVIAAYQTFQKRLQRAVLEKETSTLSYQKTRYLRSSPKLTQADLSPTLSVLPGLVGRSTTPTVQKHSKSGDICLLVDPRLRNLSAVRCLLSMTNSSYRFYMS